MMPEAAIAFAFRSAIASRCYDANEMYAIWSRLRIFGRHGKVGEENRAVKSQISVDRYRLDDPLPTHKRWRLFGIQLRNYEGVLEAAKACNIKVILAGHIHQDRVVRLQDIVIVCAGSSCVFAEGNGNWMHSLAIDVENGVARLSSKVDYQWEDAAGEFVERS
jgi:hypothetical protein